MDAAKEAVGEAKDAAAAKVEEAKQATAEKWMLLKKQ